MFIQLEIQIELDFDCRGGAKFSASLGNDFRLGKKIFLNR